MVLFGFFQSAILKRGSIQYWAHWHIPDIISLFRYRWITFVINLSSMSVHLGHEYAKKNSLMAKDAPVHVEDMSKYYNFGCPTSNRFICS